jgi:hypothetical protein
VQAGAIRRASMTLIYTAEMDTPDRQEQLRVIEQDAELLTAQQLDLLAQVESQLRAVHHTMRHIEKLRNVRHRVGPELTNGERAMTLAELAEEVAALDTHLGIEHGCCTDMTVVIGAMQERVRALRRRVALGETDVPEQPHEGEFPGDAGNGRGR